MAYDSTPAVSAVGSPENPSLQARGLAPLGSAVWTSSGVLAASGIAGIAHAASGAMAQGPGLEPTTASVEASVHNAFLLAAGHGVDGLAVPFIGGSIFFQRIWPRIDVAALAAVIVDACVAHRGDVEAVIVAFSTVDHGRFAEALALHDDPGTRLVQGSITDAVLHGCDAIVNAANMEVRFGGGISGAIASATADRGGIDREAATAVAAFWAANGD